MSDPAVLKAGKELKDKDDKKVKKKKTVKAAEGTSKSSSRKSSTVVTDSTNGTDVSGEQSVESSQNDVKNILPSENVVTVDEPKEAAPKSEINGSSTTEVEIQNKGGETKEKEKRKSADAAQLKPETVVLKEIDFKKLAELKEAFHLFDLDRDGFIDKNDLKFTFASLGKPEVPEEQLEQMLSEMPNNPVDFDGFVKIFGFKSLELDPEDVLLEALSKWDHEGTGMISEERIRHDLLVWGDKWSDLEIDCALEEAPLYKKTGRVMIDYKEFCINLCGFQKVQKSREIEKEADALEN